MGKIADGPANRRNVFFLLSIYRVFVNRVIAAHIVWLFRGDLPLSLD